MTKRLRDELSHQILVGLSTTPMQGPINVEDISAIPQHLWRRSPVGSNRKAQLAKSPLTPQLFPPACSSNVPQSSRSLFIRARGQQNESPAQHLNSIYANIRPNVEAESETGASIITTYLNTNKRQKVTDEQPIEALRALSVSSPKKP